MPKKIEQMFREHEGKLSDKWSLYLGEWDRLFSPYHDLPIKLLEIGIQNGGSLEVFGGYFSKAVKIVGCDIDPKCKNLRYEDSRIAVVVGDANSNRCESEILMQAPMYDIIIDDGSHQSSDIVRSFARYYPLICDGGIYIVEDLHASYWKNYEGGLYEPFSAMAFFKRLSDMVNYEHWRNDKTRLDLIKEFAEHLGVEFEEHELASIHSIEFVNSLCIVKRFPAEKNLLGKRVIVGTDEIVSAGWKELNGTVSQDFAMDIQDDANLDIFELINLNNSLTDQIAKREQTVLALTGQLSVITASKTWRVALILRRLRGFLLPPGSLRFRLAQKVLSYLPSPFTNRWNHNMENALVLVRNSGFFDPAWYLAQYPDIANSGMDPALHYLLHGGFEGRDPGPDFSSSGYLNSNADVQNAGINPLFHYLKHGIQEGRSPTPGNNGQLFNNGLATQLYQKWIKNNEPTLHDLERQSMQAKKWAFKPVISIITPLYNTPADVLIATIESVLAQTYPFWELCIANGSPEDETIKNILAEYTGKEARIKLATLETNLGIAGNSNAAIALAEGEFIGFLDHDDQLAPWALYEVVSAIQKYPQSDLFYSDEDRTNADGKTRFGPFFKPAFSPEYLRAINYICHFLVVRKSLGDDLGWLRSGFDGAQDFDLVLRCVEESRFVTHIPQILYHWRAAPGSTAYDGNAKGYAHEAGFKAVGDHLQRCGLKGNEISGPSLFNYRVIYNLPETPLVSIIIPNHDHSDDLRTCVSSILERSSYRNFEILIIENNSRKPATFKLYDQLKQHPGVRVLEHHHPFNFSEINNFGAQAAKGDYLLFLNNDVEVINPDWLERMLEYSLLKDVGIVGAKLYYRDNTIQHAGVIIGIGGMAGHLQKNAPGSSFGYFMKLALPQNFSAVTGACLMISKKLFEEVGKFDEAYQLALGDVDLCLKVRRAGYRIVWTPYTELYHAESKTRGYEDTPEKITRFTREKGYFNHIWKQELEFKDPYYNPNLTIDAEDMSVAPHPNQHAPRSLPGLSKGR